MLARFGMTRDESEWKTRIDPRLDAAGWVLPRGILEVREQVPGGDS